MNDSKRTFYLMMLGYDEETAQTKPPLYEGPDDDDDDDEEEEGDE